MKNVSIAAVACVGCLMVGSSDALAPQEADSQQASAPVPPTPASAPVFQPGLADLMTMLVQPRHIRLFYAGSDRNWELAAFELRELRSSFRRTGNTIPRYQGTDLNEAVATIIAPRLHDMEVAIAAADVKQFMKVYEELTNACNACHAYLEHPFLVVKSPAVSTQRIYPDQEFKVRR